jgi:hypothetical protein
VVGVRPHRRSPSALKTGSHTSKSKTESAAATEGLVEPTPAVLIIVQNLPVPFDRRVWLECQALTAAGYSVSVICPKGPQDPSEAVLNGVTLYKYRPYAAGTSRATFVGEYLGSVVADGRPGRHEYRSGVLHVRCARSRGPTSAAPVALRRRRHDASSPGAWRRPGRSGAVATAVRTAT